MTHRAGCPSQEFQVASCRLFALSVEPVLPCLRPRSPEERDCEKSISRKLGGSRSQARECAGDSTPGTLPASQEVPVLSSTGRARELAHSFIHAIIHSANTRPPMFPRGYLLMCQSGSNQETQTTPAILRERIESKEL